MNRAFIVDIIIISIISISIFSLFSLLQWKLANKSNKYLSYILPTCNLVVTTILLISLLFRTSSSFDIKLFTFYVVLNIPTIIYLMINKYSNKTNLKQQLNKINILDVE